MNYNPKPRTCYCPNCKITSEREEPNPTCTECGEQLITLLRSLLDGKIYGDGQLAK